MDEIAAMQASRLELTYLRTSGIVLASEENYPSQISGLSGGKQNGSIASVSESSLGSLDINQAPVQSTDEKTQVAMTWPNHLPQCMHNFQGHVFQQMPPYQGYLFPGMQVPPPYFQGNMLWPPKVDDSSLGHDWEPDGNKKHKSSSRNKKSSHEKGLETSNPVDSTEPSDSSSDTESDDNLQNGEKQSSVEQVRRKKSSTKVVIRNINYTTSKRDGEKGSMSDETSDEDEFIDGEALKQQVEEAVGSLERRHKSTSRHNKKSNRSIIDCSNDEDNKNLPIILGDKKEMNNSFDTDPHPLKVQEYSTSKSSEEQLSLAFNQESKKISKQRAISNDSFVATKRQTGNEDKFDLGNFEARESLNPVTKKRDGTYEELLFSQRTNEPGNHPQATAPNHSTESLIIRSQKEGDWFINNQQDKPTNRDENMNLRTFDGDDASSIADDCFLFKESKKDVLLDDSFTIQARPLNATSKITHDKAETNGTHEPEDLYMVLGRDSAAENATPSWTPEMDYEMTFYLLKPMEDTLLPSNDKGTNGKPSGNVRGKVSGKESRSKFSTGSLGKGKSNLMSRTILRAEEENRKRMEELMIQRQKRIAERSAIGNSSATSKRMPVKKTSSLKKEESKAQPPSQETEKKVFRSSTIDRLATARTTPKVEYAQSIVIPAQPKKAPLKANGLSQKTAGADKKSSPITVKTDGPQKKGRKEAMSEDPKEVPATSNINEFKDVKELHSIAPVDKNEGNVISQRDTFDDKGSNGSLSHINSSAQLDHIKGNDVGLSIAAPILSENIKTSDTISTPPPAEINAEPVHSRKKLNSDESSPKATKGFRKLLLFGRKSRTSTTN
ncbi:hypothetical protein P3X46_027039 [Hevea brasiliensis]|uniref:COP1-interacting protein 7 n=1 Tax=Hevea brasiliensis TaxID=3981 RepID=A0ABQ9L030_HEVBR|nr:hypothetical protein P3X46_027039 [Hevea brasiliensis]